MMAAVQAAVAPASVGRELKQCGFPRIRGGVSIADTRDWRLEALSPHTRVLPRRLQSPVSRIRDISVRRTSALTASPALSARVSARQQAVSIFASRAPRLMAAEVRDDGETVSRR